MAAAPKGMPPPGDVEAGPWYEEAPHATRVRAAGAVKSAPGCVTCMAMSMAAWTARDPSACRFTHQSSSAWAQLGRCGRSAAKKSSRLLGTPADVCMDSGSAGSPRSSARNARCSISNPSLRTSAKFAPPKISDDAPPRTRTVRSSPRQANRMPCLVSTAGMCLPSA